MPVIRPIYAMTNGLLVSVIFLLLYVLKVVNRNMKKIQFINKAIHFQNIAQHFYLFQIFMQSFNL